MPNVPVIERVLLVAGAQNTGKSTQLRAMFRDPRLGTQGAVPEARNVAATYALSPSRHLYLRLTSPHEMGDTLDGFLTKIASKAARGRWCVASAVQVDAARKMPELATAVRALNERFAPERIRIALLSPDRHGVNLSKINGVINELYAAAPVVEIICIDARTRMRNGLLLADTFDFA